MAETYEVCIKLSLYERLNSVDFWRLQNIFCIFCCRWWQVIFLELLLALHQPCSHLREHVISSLPPKEASLLSVLLSCLFKGFHLPLLSNQHKTSVVLEKLFISKRDVVDHSDVTRDDHLPAEKCRKRWPNYIVSYTLLVMRVLCLQKIVMVNTEQNLEINEARFFWEMGIRQILGK